MKLKGLSEEIFLAKYAYPGETEWSQRAKVIAETVAAPESTENILKYSKLFFDSINEGYFIPGGRIIFGAGRQKFNLLNCYVLYPEDSVESIAKVIKDTYLISCGGGGIGYDFSRIRPKGDDIQNIKNSAPGSISVMKMINEIGEHVRAGKNRRTALISILRVDHPDLLEFLTVKLDKKQLQNFNISVAITNDFVKAVEKDKSWSFRFKNKEYHKYNVIGQDKGQPISVYTIGVSEEDALARAIMYSKPTFTTVFEKAFKEEIKAKEIWEMLFRSAIDCGDPGIFNVDLANSYTNVSYFEFMGSTNPCLAKGTKVNTPFGYKNIEDVKEGDLVTTVDGHEPVKTVERHTNLPVFRVKFSDGGELLATASHIFHTFKGGTNQLVKLPLSQINVGDNIRIIATPLQNTDLSDYNIGLKQGILLGDGSITGLHKKIATSQKDVEYNSNVKQLFGEDNFIKDDLSRNSNSMAMGFTVEFSRTVNAELGLTANYSEEKFIPEATLNSYAKCLGVIDGLLATDGNILLKSNTPQARITTCSYKLAQDIRRALLNLGIHGRIYNSFHQDGGMIDGRKIERKHVRYDVHIMSDGLTRLAKISKLDLLHPKKGNRLKSINENYVLNSGYYKAKILSIEPAGYSDVYDLYCERSDTWVTDGYVSRGCGEVPLPNYGNCCLGHVNLSNMITDDGQVLWKRLAETIRLGVRFLDNVLKINNFAVEECRIVADKSRRIGLGVTGLHYFLIKAGYKYGDEKCCEFTERLFQTIRDEAYKASIELAKEKGSFNAFKVDEYLEEAFCKTLPPRIRADIKKYGIRNAILLTCAPCGTNSMVLGVSTGIEPIFSPIYERSYKENDIWKTQLVTDPLFKKYFDEDDPRLQLCVGAYDVTPEEHIRIQASIQKYVDQSLSKTCNLPENTTYEMIEEALANYISSVKGFTIYRAGSRGVEPYKSISIKGLNKEQISNILNNSVGYGAEQSSPSMCDITKGTCE